MDQLRIPGPTPCPPEVFQAMTKQMINHRGGEFAQALSTVTTGLKKIFQSDNDVFILTASGTGGLEAAVVNALSPGDKVLSVSIGAFGERFATIAKTFGAEIVPLKYEWGQAADANDVRQALKDNPDVKAVLVTHNETSTGVTNDLKSISSAVKEFDKLLVVDAISSLGSIDLPIDDWGCDVTVTGSQKGWMVPPGLTMVSISPKGWRANAEAKMPRFYWDLATAKTFAGKGQTPWTPAISVIYALETALEMMLKEGLPSIFARHKKIGQMTRDGVKALGLPLFADERYASNTVTSIAAPEGLDVAKLRQIMQDEHGIVLGGGQQKMKGKIFRIGHLGMVTENDITEVMAALKQALPKAGFKS